MNVNVIVAILGDYCECDIDLGVDCPMCQAASMLTDLSEQKAIHDKLESEMTKTHNMHIEALTAYWHLLHKDCPCRIKLKGVPKGKCESPWKTIQ